MAFDLSFIWAFVILIGVAVYIVADGFDLGVGILLPFVKQEAVKDEFIDSISPVWDGNETWLILGGAALMGAFPLAYAVILEAFTFPIVVMLFALILRGVAFEFRVHSPAGHKKIWTIAFVVGSYIAALMQGMMAGAFLEGFLIGTTAQGTHFFDGKDTDWISPFSLLTGVGLVIMFAVIGIFWGAMKGNDTLKNRVLNFKKPAIFALIIVLIAIMIAMLFSTKLMPLLVGARLYLVVGSMIIIGLVLLMLLGNSMSAGKGFLLTVFIMVCGMVGYTSLFFPYIIPPSITLEMAASASSSQMFGLVGTLIMLPIIIFYLSWTYFIFRGKVIAGEGY